MRKDIFRMTKHERAGLLVCIAILACVCGASLINSKKETPSQISVINRTTTEIASDSSSKVINTDKHHSRPKKKKQRHPLPPPRSRDYRNEPINR